MSLHNQEVERLGEGHGAVDLLNAPVPVEVPKSDLFPMDLEYCRQARRDGAFIDAEKPIWKNVPVNLAFGVVDAIGVVNNHFHPDEVMTDDRVKYGAIPQTKSVWVRKCQMPCRTKTARVQDPGWLRAVDHGAVLQLPQLRIPDSGIGGIGVRRDEQLARLRARLRASGRAVQPFTIGSAG